VGALSALGSPKPREGREAGVASRRDGEGRCPPGAGLPLSVAADSFVGAVPPLPVAANASANARVFPATAGASPRVGQERRTAAALERRARQLEALETSQREGGRARSTNYTLDGDIRRFCEQLQL
jgi:hypothetical protein